MKRCSICLLLLLVFLYGCAPAAVQPAPVENVSAWPTDDWQTSTPAEQGMDEALLKAAQEEIVKQQINLESLLIVRNGYLVSESYYRGSDRNQTHILYSVTKSFLATLVGIALDQGKLSGVDQPALALLPSREYDNPDARKTAMTVEDLLTMSSGLDWVEGDPAYRAMYTSQNWVKNVLDLPLREQPGETFNYCSGCSHVLSAILQEQTGMTTQDFASKYLFTPLGIKSARWEQDAQGIAIGGWGLSMTPREMAKLGYLYLNKGQWDGAQVVSASWVEAAVTRHLPAGNRLDYGYQWWINRERPAYMALGRDGQTIYVAPDLNLVIVTTATIRGNHDPILDLIEEFILPAAE